MRGFGIKKQTMKSAQFYYSAYRADDKLSLLSGQLINDILDYKPNSVLDFGMGTGKHIKQLHDLGIVTFGIDISRDNVCTAMFKHDLPFVALGTEAHLRHIVNIDIVTTCSVLDHIENVEGIIGEFKRIANKAVVIAEPLLHDPENFYYAHNYFEMGFNQSNFEWIGEDGNIYFIWHWLKGSDVEDSHLKHKEG